MASFFGIQDWFYQNVAELSGGQKQLLNLASVMAMQPSVLILDEPTSQLDPIAATDFFCHCGKDQPRARRYRHHDRTPFGGGVSRFRPGTGDGRGALISDGAPKEVGEQLKKLNHGMFFAMPVPMRVYASVDNTLSCPVTVREGREWLEAYAARRPLSPLAPEKLPVYDKNITPAVELNEVWFRYEKDGDDVLRGLSMGVRPGEFYAVVGGNGTGKTTALSLITAINKPYRGTVKIKGKEISKIGQHKLFDGLLSAVPQNPQALFVKKTLREDLTEILSGRKLSKAEKERKLTNVSAICRLDGLLSRHPYDLSGGEQQRAALAKVLLLEPEILLLDEPTKGMDGGFKQVFAAILRDLLSRGVTIIMVSHDVEFCAAYADRCALFFDGAIVSSDTPRRFFSGNSFYTTAANRMARDQLPLAVTAGDIISACGGDSGYFAIPTQERAVGPPVSGNEKDNADKQDDKEAVPEEEISAKPDSELPGRHKIIALAAAVALLVTLIIAMIFAAGHWQDFSGILTGGNIAEKLAADHDIVWRYAFFILALSAELITMFFTLSRKKGTCEAIEDQVAPEKRPSFQAHAGGDVDDSLRHTIDHLYRRILSGRPQVLLYQHACHPRDDASFRAGF